MAPHDFTLFKHLHLTQNPSCAVISSDVKLQYHSRHTGSTSFQANSTGRPLEMPSSRMCHYGIMVASLTH